MTLSKLSHVCHVTPDFLGRFESHPVTALLSRILQQDLWRGEGAEEVEVEVVVGVRVLVSQWVRHPGPR